MKPFHECMDEYRAQMEQGAIRVAYRGLMEYIMELRGHFQKEYPGYSVPGSIYQGFMDMTYFSIVPGSFKSRKLKCAIVFLHDSCRFEAWLAGTNKQVQAYYLEVFRKSGWNRYRMPATIRGADSILEYPLTEHPDFHNLPGLTSQIVQGTIEFISDIENFLASHTGM